LEGALHARTVVVNCVVASRIDLIQHRVRSGAARRKIESFARYRIGTLPIDLAGSIMWQNLLVLEDTLRFPPRIVQQSIQIH
jgi:hypothetical protein